MDRDASCADAGKHHAVDGPPPSTHFTSSGWSSAKKKERKCACWEAVSVSLPGRMVGASMILISPH